MENIRNFVIISHIDHGKSTLADRFLELTETIPKEKMRPQFLDMMPLERERGITIKMQTVRMCLNVGMLDCWNKKSETFPTSDQGERSNKRSEQTFILNLIDTPGHVDFSYEVSRSLAAVEGAILLVDATKGIQAQTLANLDLAKKQNLVIIPVINKIDLPQAKIEETGEEISNLLGTNKNEIIKISAKYSTNVGQVLGAVLKRIPPPKGDSGKPLRALIFDSKYDSFKGVIAYVRIIDGEIRKGEIIYLLQAQIEGEAKEIGYFKPGFFPQNIIAAGEIGYIATGIKEAEKVKVGDTIIKIQNSKSALRGGAFGSSKVQNLEPLPGYEEPKPMIFASFHPENPDNYDLLKEALVKLKLNDASLSFEPETKEGLGRGFRCGFLGTLHTEIVSERLQREFDLGLIISTPSVVYRITNRNDKEILVYTAQDWPEPSEIQEIEEPWVKLELMTPASYLGQVLGLLESLQGKYIETKYFGTNRLLLVQEVPLREIIIGFFYDKLKGATRGFASMNYEVLGYRPAELAKLEILIAGSKEEAFSKIVPKKRAYQESRKMVKKLKEVLPPQLFSVALQAVIDGQVIARENIRARGKDVTGPLYGGDYTRKRKLLEKQKKGKKKLREKGEVKIPQEVFLEMFKSK